MPGIALANGKSQIQCDDGAVGTKCGSDPSRWLWDTPTMQVTGPSGNSKVFIGGDPVALEGDKMAPHPNGDPCVTTAQNHEPGVSEASANVFIGGKRVVMVGCKYMKGTSINHVVTTGSSKVSIGGAKTGV
tara:strand:- start:57 stop:449 length:393 start_codon:yes stop_codon:yes gene_type:complete